MIFSRRKSFSTSNTIRGKPHTQQGRTRAYRCSSFYSARYQALNSRESDRHRLIMCHCHFLYNCIHYPPTRHIARLLRERKRSFRRRKSSVQSLYGQQQTNADEHFCPYTRQSQGNSDDTNKKRLDIVCPMEETCADVQSVNEFISKIPSKKTMTK